MGAEFRLECLQALWHDEGYASLWFTRSRRVRARDVMDLNAWLLEQSVPEPVVRLLVDVRELGAIDADVLPAAVRYYFENSRSGRGVPRVAFVAHDVLPRTVSSFLALSRAPARTFTDVDVARSWLLAPEARAGPA